MDSVRSLIHKIRISEIPESEWKQIVETAEQQSFDRTLFTVCDREWLKLIGIRA